MASREQLADVDARVPSAAEDFVVALLDKTHDRGAFECGLPALDDYLKRQARQDVERGAATAYVLVPQGAPSTIAGYSTLSATAVQLDAWPAAIAGKLPGYPLTPATLLGRLAVDRALPGRRLGERLLIDALGRSLRASRRVASVAVIVDAKDDAGAAFYARYGFKPFPEQPRRLFIAMRTVAALAE